MSCEKKCDLEERDDLNRAPVELGRVDVLLQVVVHEAVVHSVPVPHDQVKGAGREGAGDLGPVVPADALQGDVDAHRG